MLEKAYKRVYFSIRKTTLPYVSPSRDFQISLVIDDYFLIYFLIYFFVYLERGGRFKILKLKFVCEIEFEFNLIVYPFPLFREDLELLTVI